MLKIRRVVCGMSGGVDSAVAAALLKQRGYEVIGAFMKNWDEQDDTGTCLKQEEDLEDAKNTCDHLRIPFVEVNFVKDYWNEVFTRLLQDYENGFTPNPDVLCNKFIKFGSFYNYAIKNLGADCIATGHYARSSFGSFLEKYNPTSLAKLLRASDMSKDQTLFLANISQESLQRTMFPLGELYKQNVRKLAESLGMNKIARKKDSVGVCFIGKRSFPKFISKYLVEKPGLFIDVDTGKVIGEHGGVHQWTIGQRCKISGYSQALYVCFRDPKSQTILVCLGRDHPSLYSRYVMVEKPHWIAQPPPQLANKPFNCMFKFQHTQWVIPAKLEWVSDSQLIKVHLSFPTRAITQGQVGVFYRGSECLGSAKILTSDVLVKLENVLNSRVNNMIRSQSQ